MKVVYVNEQDESDPMNGVVIAEVGELVDLLNDRRGHMPHSARLSGENGFELMVGIGGYLGCVQHSSSTGDPPYLMAVSRNPQLKSGYIEFMCGGTPTAFAARYILTFEEVKKIVLDFLQTGQRSNAVSWQELEPKAIQEDIERFKGQD